MPLITEVVKPDELNSVTIAEILKRYFTTSSYDELETFWIDCAQYLLDILKAKSIIK